MSKKTQPKTRTLPKKVGAKLKPFIDKGITNGLWEDASTVTEMFANKMKDDRLKETLAQLGGIKTEIGQMFIADALLVDLSAILRQKRYNAHIEVWEVDHRTIPTAGGDRQLCGIFGQVVVEDLDGSLLEPALGNLGLWGDDAAIGDDVERDGIYQISVTCRDLEADVLDLKPLEGLSRFKDSDHDGFGDRGDLLKECFEVSDIADLEENVSRGRNDYRLVEATVSFAGVKARRDGGTFGSILLKDDSTTTLEAIESGETLLLSGITSSDIATRFGKYSKILALCTVKNDGQYGLSANVVSAEGLVVVAPPKAEPESGGDDGGDDAASYFSDDDDDDLETVDLDEEEDEVEEESTPEPVLDGTKEADPEPAEETKAEAEEAEDEDWVEESSDSESDDDDDDWDDWGSDD